MGKKKGKAAAKKGRLEVHSIESVDMPRLLAAKTQELAQYSSQVLPEATDDIQQSLSQLLADSSGLVLGINHNSPDPYNYISQLIPLLHENGITHIYFESEEKTIRDDASLCDRADFNSLVLPALSEYPTSKAKTLLIKTAKDAGIESHGIGTELREEAKTGQKRIERLLLRVTIDEDQMFENFKQQYNDQAGKFVIIVGRLHIGLAAKLNVPCLCINDFDPRLQDSQSSILDFLGNPCKQADSFSAVQAYKRQFTQIIQDQNITDAYINFIAMLAYLPNLSVRISAENIVNFKLQSTQGNNLLGRNRCSLFAAAAIGAGVVAVGAYAVACAFELTC